MSLKLMPRNGKSGFRPNWYGQFRADGKVKVVNLGIKIRGKPPASGDLADKGDKEFERSRATAQTALDRRRKIAGQLLTARRVAQSEQGDAIRETQKIIELKTHRKFTDPELAKLADCYLERIGDLSRGYVSFIRQVFVNLAEFASTWKGADGKPIAAETLLSITPELATAFLKDIAKRYSWESVKKYSNLLSGAFDRFAPIGIVNPFKGVRKRVVNDMRRGEDGERKCVEKAIHHKPLDREQVRKVWQTARDMKDEMLYNLAVTAACTGLRISDCCLLKWTSVDLSGDVINLTTQKTGALVAIPIYDYDPSSKGFEPDLGEFRKVLERRLTDSGGKDKYVFPDAARLYLTKRKNANGEEYNRGRDTLYHRGKILFAKALFEDEAKIEDIDPNASPKTIADIEASIDNTNWDDARRKRVKEIYARYKNGESYRAISAATGYGKSTISYDLGSVERLVSMKVKPGSDKPSLRTLLDRTRQVREIGCHSASLYSWHSLRASFVVMAIDNGIPLDIVRELVGHTTTDMTLEYYHPTSRQAAETARKILSLRNAQKTALGAPGDGQTTQSTVVPTNAMQSDLDALASVLLRLPDSQRHQLAALLAK